MTEAYNAVKSGMMKVHHASKEFGVPRSSLRDCLEGRVSLHCKMGRKANLSKEEEEKLIDYASNWAQLGIGFGKAKFLELGSLATKYNKPFKKLRPCDKWWVLMHRRHKKKVSLRQPEGTAARRHQCMDPVKKGKYFTCLRSELDTIDDDATRIWNMDETGMQLNVKPRRVVTAKGTKYLHARTSRNRDYYRLCQRRW